MVIEGFATTGTTRPWRAEFETLAVRGNDHVLLAQRWSKVDDPGIILEFLTVNRVDGDGLIDRAVMFDVEDLAAAIDELDRLYAESLDTTDLLRISRWWTSTTAG